MVHSTPSSPDRFPLGVGHSYHIIQVKPGVWGVYAVVDGKIHRRSELGIASEGPMDTFRRFIAKPVIFDETDWSELA